MGDPDITGLLQAWATGDRQAFDCLAPHLYEHLRRIARRHMRHERPGHTLQSSALVHEAWLRLVEVSGVRWQDRAHFLAICAEMMRRILVDAARKRKALRRGGPALEVTFDEEALPAPARGADLLALDEAMETLARVDPRKARVVELRFFGGLSVEETAKVLGLSSQSILRDWKLARAWLTREMRRGGGQSRE